MIKKWKVHEMANCCKGVWRSALMLNSVLTKQEIASLGYISMTDYYLKVWKTKEAPYTEPYVRWYGRSVDKIIIYLLPDYETSRNTVYPSFPFRFVSYSALSAATYSS